MPVELAHEEAGDGRPVVLLHAFPLTRQVFSGQLAGLSDRARVILPDLRGFGESPGPGDVPPSLDLMADDVVALLDRLGIGPCVLGGLSLGGYVTMNILRRYPDRVAAAILMDSKAAADDETARANREHMAAAILDSGPQVLGGMIDNLLGVTTRRTRPEVVDQVSGWLAAAEPRAVAWTQRAMAARPSSFEVLAGVAVPAFVIVGEEDTISPHDDALAMSQAFHPPAPVYVIPGAGHLSAIENPDSVTSALRDVLRHV